MDQICVQQFFEVLCTCIYLWERFQAYCITASLSQMDEKRFLQLVLVCSCKANSHLLTSVWFLVFVAVLMLFVVALKWSTETIFHLGNICRLLLNHFRVFSLLHIKVSCLSSHLQDWWDISVLSYSGGIRSFCLLEVHHIAPCVLKVWH